MAPREPIPRYTLNWRPWYTSVSPGDSSQPASREPSITTLPPAAIALAMSPEYLIPPSAIMGTSYSAATCAASNTAVTWGTPIPATTRVVQMEPGPMPIFTQSAPASMRARVPSAVATLPATICTSGYRDLIRITHSRMFREWPWAESRQSTSAPASTKAATRSSTSAVTPMAAPTSSRPFSSRAELG